MAYVTEILSGGKAVPTLTLTALRFNEEPASILAFTPSLDAVLSDGTLTATVTLRTPSPETLTVIVAAYSGNGQMLAVKLTPASLVRTEETVQVTLNGCTQAKLVKAFFLTDGYVPRTAPLEKTL